MPFRSSKLSIPLVIPPVRAENSLADDVPIPCLNFLYLSILLSAEVMEDFVPLPLMYDSMFPDFAFTSSVPVSGLPTLCLALSRRLFISLTSFPLFLSSFPLPNISSYFAPPNITRPAITDCAACERPVNAPAFTLPIHPPDVIDCAISPTFSITCESINSIIASAAMPCMLLVVTTRFIT